MQCIVATDARWCQTAHEMGCLVEDTVLRFIRRELADEAYADVDAHIAVCGDCRGLVADVAKSFFDSGSSNASLAADSQTIVKVVDTLSPLLPGDHVEPYVITEQIGAGGMGVLYAAHDPRLNRKVALKVLREDARDEGGHRQAWLLREAQSMAQLSHPNVVSVFDIGRFETRVFIVMEFVEGRTLRQWSGERARSWQETLEAFLEAGKGLAAAHAVGIVHRDFKPENVMVGLDGRVRVTDFGLARPLALDEDSHETSIPSPSTNARASFAMWTVALTKTGTLKGTPAYMAPEQFRCMRPDARTDQFSFCVALYEGLYRARPFPSETGPELVEHVLSGRILPASKDSDVPMAVRTVLLRGLSTLPEHRYPSVADLLLALTEANGTDRGAGKATRGWASLFAALLFLIGVAVAFRPWQRQPLQSSPFPTTAPLVSVVAIPSVDPSPVRGDTSAASHPSEPEGVPPGLAASPAMEHVFGPRRENKKGSRPASKSHSIPSATPPRAYDDLPMEPSFVQASH